MEEQIERAIEVLRQGGIVIYPTDTAFGIGCRVDDEKAVERLFELRRRPPQQATPVLFDSLSRVQEYVLPFDKEIEQLMKKHWPGALTIILPCVTEKIPSMVRGGGVTLGVRVPDHSVVWELVKGVGVPILGPSANFHGESTPYEFSSLDKTLLKLADYTIEGKTKGSNLASTVIDCSVSPWKIIRQGSVKISE
jgi:L-threonylcarbamoyladenylate synthase